MDIRERSNVIRLQRENFTYSTCGKCGLPWNHCESKVVTPEGSNSGMFALCTYCWENSSVEERLSFYMVIWYQWRSYGHTPFTLESLEKAIING